jgi:hypothetical protein
MVREIEMVSRAQVTGLVCNTHLMSETTSEVVREGYAMALEVGEALDLPVVAVCVQDRMIDALNGAAFDCALLSLRRIVMPAHEQTLQQRTTGPLFVLN